MSWGRRTRAAVLGALVLVTGGTVRAADAIRVEDDVHLGVASCATSMCHGKLSAQENENVWLNEYRIWSTRDRHAQAYRTLMSDESKRIAEKLGLRSAHTAKICLDCHADNVPEDKRGPKFQITDGVGCEACHGGSEQWIESHAESDASHQDNLAKGMYPTEDPLSRAGICLSCHLGTKNQFATHRIMGAGHPRLAFELEAFTANQPAHYEVDDDYVARKGEISSFELWLTGQLESAERYLELVGSELLEGDAGMYPELAFYDCHSCHHPMEDQRWTRRQAGPGVEPGSLRLQDQHLRVLSVVAGVLDSAAADKLRQATREMVLAGQQSPERLRAAADAAVAVVRDRQQAWAERDFSDSDAAAVRRALLSAAADGRLADFYDAEQVFLAVESLSLYLDDADDHQQALDALFLAVEDDASYDPEAFLRAASRALNGFG
ncbi:MAG: multiheme c-type cytochrome [Pseudomonadota bacterium]